MSEPIAICNLLVIGLTCLVSWHGFRSQLFEEKYIFEPRAILAGKQYYRLVTSACLHSGWGHLFLNMLSLYWFGGPIELRFGPATFLLIYFGAIVGGDLLSLYVHRNHEYRSYGASGGTCGIIFAYLLLFPGAAIYQFPIPVPVPGWLYAIGFMVGSFFAMKAHRDNIGHDAHLGGAIVGLLIAAAAQPELARANLRILLIVSSAAIVLLIYLWMNPLFLPVNSFFGPYSKTKKQVKKLPTYKREALQIDEILEKISSKGMDSLSPEEREVLLSASTKSQRRAESKKPESGLAI
jgi:membrane associated rhomboid family serine protease